MVNLYILLLTAHFSFPFPVYNFSAELPTFIYEVQEMSLWSGGSCNFMLDSPAEQIPSLSLHNSSNKKVMELLSIGGSLITGLGLIMSKKKHLNVPFRKHEASLCASQECLERVVIKHPDKEESLSVLCCHIKGHFLH